MAQLISPQEVIDRSFTNKQTDVDLINDSFIEIAQEEHIKSVLAGDVDDVDSLYFDIVTQNNECTLTAENALLLENYIKPALAFYVKYEILVDMMVNTSSQGLQVINTEFSRSASASERSDLARKAKSHGDTLRDKMVRYLQDNARSTQYTKYLAGANKSNQTVFIGGMILDGGATRSSSNDPYAPR